MTGQSGKFGIDEDSLVHLMGILTNMYSDAEAAVVREYIVNAYDSHIEAGQTRPIEVTTPSAFNPTYTVQDFGVGMSIDDVANIYSKYVSSTKRESNDAVGMLGIGSKSALTYTNSFAVTAIKNGVRAQVLISVDDAGVPEFRVIDTSTTGEHNGVTISIPVKDRNSFAEKTREFLKFWPQGLVLVDGNPTQPHDFVRVTDTRYIKTNVGYGDNSYVVMGNIAYKVEREQLSPDHRFASMPFQFMCIVPIGSVDIAPSREALFYTPRTLKVINELSDNIYEDYINVLIKEFAEIKKPLDALLKFTALPYSVKKDQRIRDIKFEGSLLLGNDHSITFAHTHAFMDHSDRWRVNPRTGYLNTSNLVSGESVIVVGSSDKPTPTLRRRMAQFLKNNNYKPRTSVIMVDKDPDLVWLRDIKRVSLDTIKAEVLPRGPRSAARKDAPYDTYKWVDGSVEWELTSNITGKICYMSSANLRGNNRSGERDTPNEIVKSLPDYTMVVMSSNRFSKFKRNFPQAITVDSAVQQRINQLTKSKFVYSVNDIGFVLQYFVRQADVNRIDDPELVEFINDVTGRSGNTSWDEASALTRNAIRVKLMVRMPDVPKPELHTDNYPLLKRIGNDLNDEVYFYLNAKYAFMQAAKENDK